MQSCISGARIIADRAWLAQGPSTGLPEPDPLWAGPAHDPRWDSVGRQQSWSLNLESVMQLSARNQIPARVTSINAGEAIANVELSANGVRLVASVTVEAVRELGLAEGSNVTAVIKASDVILATG
jgi:molybdopterin-binding protein